eukprot:2868059-Pyramimonas_sp.AAC.1
MARFPSRSLARTAASAGCAVESPSTTSNVTLLPLLSPSVAGKECAGPDAAVNEVTTGSRDGSCSNLNKMSKRLATAVGAPALSTTPGASKSKLASKRKVEV